MIYYFNVAVLMMFNKPNSGLPSQHRNRANGNVPNLIKKINKALGFHKNSRFLWQIENIEGIGANATGIRADVEGIGAEVATNAETIAKNKADVEGIVTDVKGIEADVEGIEADVATNAQTIADNTADTANNLTDIREKIEGNTVDILTNVINIEKNVSGVITIPGFPGDYDNNLDLTWVIQAPLGQLIKVSFLNFDVEYDSSCG